MNVKSNGILVESVDGKYTSGHNNGRKDDVTYEYVKQGDREEGFAAMYIITPCKEHRPALEAAGYKFAEKASAKKRLESVNDEWLQ